MTIAFMGAPVKFRASEIDHTSDGAIGGHAVQVLTKPLAVRALATRRLLRALVALSDGAVLRTATQSGILPLP